MHRKKKVIIISILLFIGLCIVGFLLFYSRQTKKVVAPVVAPKSEVLTVNFLDIGQGDAELITFPDDEQMLVDCSTDARIIEAIGRVMPFYDRSIDYLVVTHPHLDHYGGCEDVLRRYEVKHIILNGFEMHAPAWESLARAVGQEVGTPAILVSTSTLSIASTTIEWLYPDHALATSPNVPALSGEVNPNNTSVVFRLTYGATSILFMGDAEREEEEYLLKIASSTLDADILKAGHHGSTTSSNDPFLKMVTPKETIFSAGVGNSFGHPSIRVIRRVERAGSRIWRTDTMGDITLTIADDGTWKMSSSKENP